jgi:aryl-alcohol dehydrogenase-like predicted oxidoreductase
MKKRIFGKTGWEVTEVGFGTWNIGGAWGDVSDQEGYAAIHAALDGGINFLDTADVYGDGRSEQHIAKVLNERNTDERIYVVTKAGRRLDPHTAEGYNKGNLEAFVERSRQYLQQDTLDLVQLHCPPTDVYYNPVVFEALEDMIEKGWIRHYGVSVEKVEQALIALEYPGMVSVQIIFNMLRQRPYELFFRQAQQENVAVIARVPLASGLLSGKLTRQTTFPENDHRNFNRHGEAFDVGETFSGVPYERGLEAVDALREIVPEGVSMAQFALRWILMHDAVTTVIPGSTKPGHIRANIDAASLPPLTHEQMGAVRDIYDKYAREYVHMRW